ncbi:MAG TPA: Wzz/FepE/Etk N-terminal domain-containing protein [Methylovirgula sp.]|nr:Wzz/FepE/Etk N-terminal domain-containing protein [Methylovirgula sp.]
MSQPLEPNASFDDSTSELDLGALARAFKRKKHWILWPTLFAFALAAIFVTLAKPMFTAETQVLLENQESYLPRPQQQQAELPAESLDDNWIGSQIQLITSRDLARRVIERLHLVGNPDLDPGAHVDSLSRVLILFGFLRDPTTQTPVDRVVDYFATHLTAYSPVKTRVLTIQFQAHDPAMAARIANAIADIYLETQSEAKRQRAKMAAAVLETQIAELRGKVSKAADAVERYRASSGLLAGTNNMTISGQQLADLNTDLSKARTDEADAQAKATLVRDMIRTGKIADVADVANNDLVRRIAEQVVTAKAQLALELRTLLPGHPRIKELNAQIADLEGQLRAAALKTARTLENNAKIAAARVANLEAALSQQKTSVSRSNVDEVQLRELERTAQALRDQLAATLAKYQEAVARETSPVTPSDARVINRAVPPDQPSFPKKGPMIAFATLAALILSSAAVVGSELLAGSQATPIAPVPIEQPRPLVGPEPAKASNKQMLDRLRAFGRSAASERREPLKEPTFGSDDKVAAPRIVSGETPEAAPDVEPPVARSAPAEVRKAAAAPAGACIVATSVVSTKLAATALLDFIRSLAKDGRPILIDLESQDSEIVARLRAEAEDAADDAYVGLTELLNGNASFAEVIRRDPASRMHFISFGAPAEIRAGDLDLVLEALTQTYDFIVLAAPPLSESPLAKLLASYGDFVVLVTSPQTKDQNDKAYHSLVKAGASEIVTIGASGKPNFKTRDVA